MPPGSIDPAFRPFAMRCIAGGALLMVIGVVLGAFGAHVLQEMLTPKRLASFQTGVTYHFLHALGLILIGIVARVTQPSPWLKRAAVLMLLGIVFFAGSIYAMALGAPRWLGMVAPVGGISFMLGWAALALHASRSE
jgi:uncharacterized membrane protein YgdD (TMEM256/DUF423 family)